MSEEIEKKDKKVELKPLADDWFGTHHIMTRTITVVVVGIFMYVFLKPLSPEYAQIISYMLVLVFITITFGINSLKLIIDLVKAWRNK